MTLLERLKLRIDDGDTMPTDAVLNECLDEAKEIIFQRRFPYDPWPEEVEAQYVGLQLRIALELVNRIGDEGETVHLEENIHRHYANGWVSPSLLEEITPYVGVI